MTKKVKYNNAKVCYHDFDIKDYGIYYICGKCGTSRFIDFEPYLYQNPSRKHLKWKLKEISEAMEELNNIRETIVNHLNN
jgi:hypothetical protein